MWIWELRNFCLYFAFSLYITLRLNTQKGFHDHWKVHSILFCSPALPFWQYFSKYKICGLKAFHWWSLPLCYWFTIVQSSFKRIVFISSTFFFHLFCRQIGRILENLLPEKLHPTCTYANVKWLLFFTRFAWDRQNSKFYPNHVLKNWVRVQTISTKGLQ